SISGTIVRVRTKAVGAIRSTAGFEPISRTNDGLLDVLQAGRNDDAGYSYYVMELADNEGRESVNLRGGVGEIEPHSPAHSPTGPPAVFNPEVYTPKTLATLIQRRA